MLKNCNKEDCATKHSFSPSNHFFFPFRLQDDLFNQFTPLYTDRTLFDGKRVSAFDVDQCSESSVKNYFDSQRNELNIDVAEEDSSLMLWSLLSFLVVFVTF